MKFTSGMLMSLQFLGFLGLTVLLTAMAPQGNLTILIPAGIIWFVGTFVVAVRMAKLDLGKSSFGGTLIIFIALSLIDVLGFYILMHIFIFLYMLYL